MGSKQTIIGNPLLITDLTVGNYVIQCKARGGGNTVDINVSVKNAAVDVLENNNGAFHFAKSTLAVNNGEGIDCESYANVTKIICICGDEEKDIDSVGIHTFSNGFSIETYDTKKGNYKSQINGNTYPKQKRVVCRTLATDTDTVILIPTLYSAGQGYLDLRRTYKLI